MHNSTLKKNQVRLKPCNRMPWYSRSNIIEASTIVANEKTTISRVLNETRNKGKADRAEDIKGIFTIKQTQKIWRIMKLNILELLQMCAHAATPSSSTPAPT